MTEHLTRSSSPLLSHLPNTDLLFITAGCRFIGVKEVNGILLGELDMSLTPFSRELASKYPQAGRELGRLILNDDTFRWLHSLEEISSVPCPYYVWWNKDNKKKIAILNTCYNSPHDDDLTAKSIKTLRFLAVTQLRDKRIVIPDIGIHQLEPNITIAK